MVLESCSRNVLKGFLRDLIGSPDQVPLNMGSLKFPPDREPADHDKRE